MQARLSALDRFAQTQKIPEPLYIRLKRHIEENLQQQDHGIERKELVGRLPPAL